MSSKTVFLGLVFFLVAGCSAHQPNLEPKPLVATSTMYSIVSEAIDSSDLPWWYRFNEPQLNSLVHQSLDENFEIRSAVQRFIQSAELTRQARAELFPELDVGAGSEQSWDEDGKFDSRNSIGAGLFWELDLFGRLRSEKLAREFLEKAAREDIEQFRLSVSRSVVEAFYDVVEQRQQLRLLRQQLKTDQELLALIQLRFENGIASRVDVLQQKSQVNEAEALIPIALALLRVAENRLDLLLGSVPDGVDRVDASSNFPQEAQSIQTGVPSELLLNRPDLRRLQAQVIALDARIGRAVAERLPILTLSGSSLFAAGTGSPGAVTRLLAELVQPVIDWGKREAEQVRSQAEFEEALLIYTQAYIDAVGEVESSLYQLSRQREFLRLLAQRSQILTETVDEAQKRYTAGLTDYLPVLDATKELRRVERELLRQEREKIALETQIYVSLGGKLPPMLNS